MPGRLDSSNALSCITEQEELLQTRIKPTHITEFMVGEFQSMALFSEINPTFTA